MVHVSETGTCSICHAENVKLFDNGRMICFKCAGRKGGISPKKSRDVYLCEKCHKRVKKGQPQCLNCGELQDWSKVNIIFEKPEILKW